MAVARSWRRARRKTWRAWRARTPGVTSSRCWARSSEQVLEVDRRLVAVALQVVLAAARRPQVARRQRQRFLVADLEREDDVLAALDELPGDVSRGADHVVLPERERREADARQHALVADDADDHV